MTDNFRQSKNRSIRYGRMSRVFLNSSWKASLQTLPADITKPCWPGGAQSSSSCLSQVPPIGSSWRSAGDQTDVANGVNLAEKHIMIASCTCVKIHTEDACRLSKLEKLVQELRTEMQDLRSRCSPVLTRSSDLLESATSEDPSESRTVARRRRRKQLEARRQAEARLTPEDITSEDSSSGSGARNQRVNDQRSLELGLISQDETRPRSLLDAINSRVRGFTSLPAPPAAPQIVSLFFSNWRRVLGCMWNDYSGVYDLSRLFAEPRHPLEDRDREVDESFGWLFQLDDGEQSGDDGDEYFDSEIEIRELMYEDYATSNDSDSSIEIIEDSETILRREMYEQFEIDRSEPEVLLDPRKEVESDPKKTDKANKWRQRWEKFQERFFHSRDVDLEAALNKVAALDKDSVKVVSKLDSNQRWVMKKGDDGDVICTLEPIPAVNNNLPDASNKGLAFDSDENRPRKVLVLSCFMKKRGLPFVDVGLYYHLKNANLNSGTVVSSYTKLCTKADLYLKQFRVSQYEGQLLLEVKLWTVLAAMLPLKSEMEALKLLGKKSVFCAMNDAAAFKRTGQIKERRWFGLLPSRQHALQHE